MRKRRLPFSQGVRAHTVKRAQTRLVTDPALKEATQGDKVDGVRRRLLVPPKPLSADDIRRAKLRQQHSGVSRNSLLSSKEDCSTVSPDASGPGQKGLLLRASSGALRQPHATKHSPQSMSSPQKQVMTKNHPVPSTIEATPVCIEAPGAALGEDRKLPVDVDSTNVDEAANKKLHSRSASSGADVVRPMSMSIGEPGKQPASIQDLFEAAFACVAWSLPPGEHLVLRFVLHPN